jgi:DNA-binding LacI/PurR family transcriptional regulator
MLANRDRLISVYHDLTSLGIASVDNSRPQWAAAMVEHLMSLGHTRIDCLKAQPGVGKCSRIAGWQDAIEKHNITGTLFEAPVKSFELNWIHAYEMALDALTDNKMARAVFCTTVSVAKGLGRAVFELGLEPGKDIFYCTMDSPLEAIYEVPSITTFNLHPLQHYIHQAMQWLEHDQASDASEPLHLMPQQVPDVLRCESTGFRISVRHMQVHEDFRDD